MNKQHLACLVLNDRVAVDAGSLSFSTNEIQKKLIRDVVLTHAHMDHIAGLPLFIDDHFSELETPVTVYASKEVLAVLREHVFNWQIYPNFTELENDFGRVLELVEVNEKESFDVSGLTFTPINVSHKVPTFGFVIEEGSASIAVTGDTSETEEFWKIVSEKKNLDALFIECAFPNELDELAVVSHHLTPKRLVNELEKFNNSTCPIYVINIKPVHRETIISQINELNIDRLEILDVGRDYVIS